MDESRPEPVVNGAAAAGAVTAVVGLLGIIAVTAHWITPEDSAVLGPAVANGVIALVGAVSALVAAVRARRHVTPLSDPRAADGTPLVRSGPQQPGIADHAAPE